MEARLIPTVPRHGAAPGHATVRRRAAIPRRSPASDLLWRLDSLNKFLLSASPVVQLTPGLGREVCQALGFARLAFLRADFSRRQVWTPAGWGIDLEALAMIREPFEASPWIAGSIASGMPVFTCSSRINRVLPIDYVERFGLSALFCVPIHDSAGPVGAILLDQVGEPFAVSEALIAVARAVGESIGRALEAAAPTTHPDDFNPAHLTPRQLQILRMLGRGLSNKEIARATALSVFTVRDHISALLHELEVGSRSAAVARGWQLGLLGEPSAAG